MGVGKSKRENGTHTLHGYLAWRWIVCCGFREAFILNYKFILNKRRKREPEKLAVHIKSSNQNSTQTCIIYCYPNIMLLPLTHETTFVY